MKAKKSKQPKKSKTVVQLKDIKPKKEPKGGDARAGVGILRSIDSGPTW
jgi:hypothetical protein